MGDEVGDYDFIWWQNVRGRKLKGESDSPEPLATGGAYGQEVNEKLDIERGGLVKISGG